MKRCPMTRELTLRQVGDSIGATLPKDMADRQNLTPGDRVLAVETDQGILITPYNPVTERGLAIAARVARRYRNVMRELAK
jgi:antitoxin MazE